MYSPSVPRDDACKVRLTKELSIDVLPYVQEGKIKPIIDYVFEFIEIRQADEWSEMKILVRLLCG